MREETKLILEALQKPTWVVPANQVCLKCEKLREMIDLLIGFIPDGWEMPLGWSAIVGQAKAILEEELK